MPAGVEPEEAMPECRNADRAGVLGRPVRMDGVQTRGDCLQETPSRVSRGVYWTWWERPAIARPWPS
jgi:hypothetical protein